MNIELTDSVFKSIRQVIQSKNVEAYLVGGYVRDLLLGRPSKDIDIVVLGDGIAIAKALAELIPGSDFAFFKNFGTAMVKTPEWEIEFVGARKESYSHHSRKPFVQSGTLTDDQNRRDFTINALAVGLQQHNDELLIDPFGGVNDLNNKVIRTPLNPDITFSDDPLRMMRAIRFATQLQFDIEEETYKAIARNKERIGIVSGERIAEELHKIMLAAKPSKGLKLLHESGLLQLIFPELAALHGVETKEGKAHKDNFYHTLMVVDNISTETTDLWLRWAALLHDIAKPLTKRFVKGEGWTFHGHEDKGSKMVPNLFRKLKLPLNEKMKFVQKMVALHHRPKALAEEGVTDSAIRRLVVDAGDDLDALFVLCRADMTSANPNKIALYRNNLKQVEQQVAEVAERDALRNFQPPVTGEDIMALYGIGPGKEIGILKTEVREAILEGKIPNARIEALELLHQKAMALGLKRKN